MSVLREIRGTEAWNRIESQLESLARLTEESAMKTMQHPFNNLDEARSYAAQAVGIRAALAMLQKEVNA